MTAQLGDRVRDMVTGFEGMMVARTMWLHGCDRITVEPEKLDEKGMPQDAQVFDELRLEVVEQRKGPPVAKVAVPITKRGGPQNDKVATRRL